MPLMNPWDYGDSAFNSRSVTTFHRLTSCIGKSAAHSANSVSKVARSERFELPTLGIEIRCSIQLSYERVPVRLPD